MFLPLITLLLGLAAFPVDLLLGRFALRGAAAADDRRRDRSSCRCRASALVYSIAGAHIVIERAKQSAVLQQGYLGMGVGTQELIPFWKIDSIIVRELTPHDYRGHQDDFAQYEIVDPQGERQARSPSAW